MRKARFQIGDIVKHRIFPFRGVIYDVDPVFANTEEWWLSIPAEVRPIKDQPFYHLFAENDETSYVAYVSEQNLLYDDSNQELTNPQIKDVFDKFDGKRYHVRENRVH
ncbi:heat shock protein HspQ [Alphaproteobacteria bacterium]|nr:heat shock protein HspQ [Alphaproteobacteria bacterium]